MKITVIHGQNHKQSTYHISQILIDKIGTNHEVNEFFLPKDFDEFCVGCYQCVLKDQTVCPHYNKLKPITESIEKADLLIFTTPVYCLHASASMKALLDHCFTYFMVHRPKKAMFYKKAVIITAAAGSFKNGAAKDIKDSLAYWGISDIYKYQTTVQAMSWGEVKEEKKIKINQSMYKIATKIKSKPARVSLKTKGLFYVMRMLHLKGWGVPQDKTYWAELGWLNKNRPWK